ILVQFRLVVLTQMPVHAFLDVVMSNVLTLYIHDYTPKCQDQSSLDHFLSSVFCLMLVQWTGMLPTTQSVQEMCQSLSPYLKSHFDLSSQPESFRKWSTLSLFLSLPL